MNVSSSGPVGPRLSSSESYGIGGGPTGGLGTGSFWDSMGIDSASGSSVAGIRMDLLDSFKSDVGTGFVGVDMGDQFGQLQGQHGNVKGSWNE